MRQSIGRIHVNTVSDTSVLFSDSYIKYANRASRRDVRDASV